ncbi:hypothetical protein ABMA27_002730 [Loxostege sticticalis]|uniref:Uncharacterized protein n=1 Tax=Loxostege sticticalis TaxID=481309 RepID=A0ABR3HUP4_LOXSC
MESLINYQETLYSRLVKAKTNFKKSPKDRITALYVEGKLEILEEIWSEFLSGHKHLMQTITSQQIEETKSNYFKGEVFDEAEEVYFEYKLELKTILSTFNTQSNAKSTTDSSNKNNNASKKSVSVKLPKVNIPVFSGKYSEWSTFRDLFSSLIHTNTDLDNVQKLLYLKGYVTGEAEQLLCWKLLEERYDNKRYISHHLIKRLLSQKNITHESASSLKELMYTTNDCLAALSNIGINTDSWDIIIIHILTLKLDPESRRQWEFNATDCNSSDELPTYKQFQEFITKRYRAIEFLDSRSNAVNRSTPLNKTKSMHIANVKCPVCSEEHKLNFCKKFCSESVESRRNFVQTNNICFCCLGSNHPARNCLSNGKCRICKKKHHALLHPTSNCTVEGQVGNKQKNTSNNQEPSSSVGNAEPVVSCFYPTAKEGG